jgi:hypothetical protein
MAGLAFMLPPKLLAGLSAAEAALASTWWSKLDDAERAELLAAWSPKAHSCSYTLLPQDDGLRWRRLDVRVEAEVERGDGDGDEDPDWPGDLYEYLINHEIFLADGPGLHICTRHEAGREAARTAGVPAAFVCPLGAGDCPLSAMSARAEGRAIRFVLRCRLATAP